MPMKGLDNVRLAMSDLKTSANDDVRGFYFSGLKVIIKETPRDEGRASNNWFLTVGSPSTRVTDGDDGGAPNFSELNNLPKDVLNKTIYLSNNLPYINLLEYGGYPIPGGDLTTNGFSKQAPNGWVRATVIKMANKIRAL